MSKDKKANLPKSTATASVHGGTTRHLSMENHPKTMPIFETSVFTYDSLEQVDDFLSGNPDNYMYTRLGNPNQRALEDWILLMETLPLDGAGGANSAAGAGSTPPARHPDGQPWASCSASSGLAAIMAAISAICDAGSTMAAAQDIYGGTQSLLEKECTRWGIRPVFVDSAAIANGTRSLPPDTRVFLVESASNPLLRVADLPRLASAAHNVGASLVVDNTFLSPALFKPLAHGADAVVHSSTKYINGHSDATGGLFTGPADWAEKVRRVIANTGAHLAPFEAWLTLRGAKTLDLRMRAHNANALHIAAWLETRPEVSRVWHPGLASHPDTALANTLFPLGSGGMLSFDLAGGLAAAKGFISSLERITFAPSLAGVASSISHPQKTSHRAHSPESLSALGIGPGTIRLSVGIESVLDIQADLARALDALASGTDTSTTKKGRT